MKEIIQKKPFEEELESTLKEKEILVKEIHHRVKNNLQIISSLLNLQAQYIKDKDALDAFHDSQNRVRAIALVHEKLYQNKDFSKLNFSVYVRDLVSNLLTNFNQGESDILTNVMIDELYLSLDLAVNLGLIITELISNSVKHAFQHHKYSPHDEKPKVTIILKVNTENSLSLVVKDNGSGFDYHSIVKVNLTLGLQLVQGLIDQIKGELLFEGGNGSKYQIIFPFL